MPDSDNVFPAPLLSFLQALELLGQEIWVKTHIKFAEHDSAMFAAVFVSPIVNAPHKS